uniref:HlyD family secretion protein n=1 Tax=Sneathiella sp. TaxID=1964365 RepID=UPI0035699895
MPQETIDNQTNTSSRQETLPATPIEDERGLQKHPASPRRRRWIRRSLLLLGPLIVILVGGYIYFTGGRYVSTENAYVKADKVMVAAEVSGLISQVDVHENQHVNAGDILFRIDDRTYRIALSQAEAGVANVRDEIAGLKATYRQKQEELSLAQSNVNFAKKEYDRQNKLITTNAISHSKLDATSHALDVARQEVLVTRQELSEIKAQLAGNPDVAVEDHPHYKAMLAAQDRATLDLERTVVRAPFEGIAGNTPQIGQQVVGNGAFSSPVMSLVASTNIWIEANFKETDLTHVEPGQTVTVHVDTYPDRDWEGTVQSVSQATGAEFSVIPPQNATGNWVKVVQRIPVRISVKTEDDGPMLRAGMSTAVDIDTEHQRPMP